MFYERVLRANDKETPQRLSLDSIADFLGMQRERNKHNALEDAELTAKCLAEMFRRASELKM